MGLPFAASLRALSHPNTAFAQAPPTLGKALRDMLLIWTPLAGANTVWVVWQAVRTYEGLRVGARIPWILARLGVAPGDFQELINLLPAPPLFGRVWPWLLLLVPLGVLGTWLHHAVWDHTCLWVLGGLKQRRGFRTSLLAEAEALRIAAVGTLLGFLGYLPALDLLLALPLVLLGAYLWLFRGYALAARHGCAPWKGIAATMLHAVLLGGLALGVFALVLYQIQMAR